MPAVRTLSQLPELKDLTNETLVSMAQPQKMDINDEEEKIFYYQSRKVKISSLMKYTIAAVHRDLDTNNGLYGINISTLRQNVDSLSTGGSDSVPVDELGRKHFNKAPYIDESLSSFDYEIYGQSSDGRTLFDTGKKAVSVNTLSNYVFMNASPNMTSAFGFVTHLSSNSNAEKDQIDRYLQLIDDTVSNKPYQFGLTPDSKRLIQNEFIFKINPGESESNVWQAPASGMFTCYGWLDERQNDIVNNSNRWVALLAQNEFGNANNKWFILQLQPFIKNKYLSYVGFSFPVSLGLKLKIRIGFEAGSNSDKYYNVNGGIANHVPNAFFGGVYTGTLQNKAIKVDFDKYGKTGLPNSDGFDEYYASQDELMDLSNTLCAEAAEHNRKDTSMSSIIDKINRDINTLSLLIGANTPDYDSQLSTISNQISSLSVDLKKKAPYVNQLQRTGGNQKQSRLRLLSNMNDAQYTGAAKIWTIDREESNGNLYYLTTSAAYANTTRPETFVGEVDPTTKTDAARRTEAIKGLQGTGALKNPGPESYAVGDVLKTSTTSYARYGSEGHQSLLGCWYMDDNFFYYKVSKNSTVRILLYPDCMSNQAMVDCFLIHRQTENNVIHKKYTSLGRAIEMFNGINDATETITMPLSAGTELAFAIYFLPKVEASGVAVSGKVSATSFSKASIKKSFKSGNNTGLDWTNLMSVRICSDGMTVKDPTAITLTVKGAITEAHDKAGTVSLRVVNSSGQVVGTAKTLGSAKIKQTINGTCTWSKTELINRSGKPLTPVLKIQGRITGVNHSSTSDPQVVFCDAYVSDFSGTYKSLTTNSTPVGIDNWKGMPWGVPLYTYGDLSSIVQNEKDEMASSGQKRWSLVHPKNRNQRGAVIDGTRTVAVIHEFWD